MALFETAVMRGTNGARPAPDPAKVGRLYYQTDGTAGLFRDSGTAWEYCDPTTVPAHTHPITDLTTDIATQAELDAHTGDTAAAHAASAIAFTPNGSIAATDVQAAIQEVRDEAAGGSVATDAIWDAAGDLAVGSGANTAAKLAQGANGTFLGVSGGALGYYTPAAGGGLTFKRTVLRNFTTLGTSSTSWVAVDSTNFPYLTLSCATGDVIEIVFTGECYATGSSTYLQLDAEVDRPTSANEYAKGAGTRSSIHRITGDRNAVLLHTEYTCNESGTHGFRPVWSVNPSFVIQLDGATTALFMVKNLGQPAA